MRLRASHSWALPWLALGVAVWSFARNGRAQPHDAADLDASTARADAGADDGACPAPRVQVDRDAHCCLPGQSWRGARCVGAVTSCAPGETHDGAVCVARSHAPTADADTPTLRVAPAPAVTVAVPATMTVVPGGVFRMGGRWIELGPYALDRTEVAAQDYRRCVDAGVCAPLLDPAQQMEGPTRARRPVVNVTHAMAARYCGWSGGRLPTDAEWVFAARGVDGRRYPWGERRADCSLARVAGCAPADTADVGSFAAGAGPFGALDLAGNVAEWVRDRAGAVRGEGVLRDPTGPESGDARLVRGGSFRAEPDGVSTFARDEVDAREARVDVGFRCARGL